MIVIIDYNMGNPGSILNMLKKIGAKAKISANTEDIRSAKKLILPGVGAFDNAMMNLNNLNLIPILNEAVISRKTPILGICLGMQLFSKRSEEGTLAGLAWLDAETMKLKPDNNQSLKIPHMGWNTIEVKRECGLFGSMYEEPRFYFAHSYHVKCNNAEDVAAATYYGQEFCSAIAHENIFAVQFHPEKSHKFGLKLLRNFAELC